jgi:hypothetical protein
MKLTSSIRILTALVFSAAFITFTLAHESQNQDKAASATSGSFIKADAAGVSPAWLAQAKAGYPLDRCPVSGDNLEGGDMGPPQDYVYREEGKPDRLVRLCCNHCVRDFKKDPAKYLKMIDDAATAKAKTALSK